MPDLREIIRSVCSSQAKFAVLKLFKENPYVMDNRFGLSLWVGKPEELLGPELEEMIRLGVIQRWGSEPGAIYAYTRDKELRQSIEDHWDDIAETASDLRWRQEREKEESYTSLQDESDEEEESDE